MAENKSEYCTMIICHAISTNNELKYLKHLRILAAKHATHPDPKDYLAA